jgi:hypothetical protein
MNACAGRGAFPIKFNGSLFTVDWNYDADSGMGDEAFLENTALPLAEAVPTYYDEHFPRRGGKLCLTPAQVIEQWWEAQNPMPEIAGMRACLSALLDWPEDRCPRRDDWRRLLAELPSMPVRGKRRQAGLPIGGVPAPVSFQGFDIAIAKGIEAGAPGIADSIPGLHVWLINRSAAGIHGLNAIAVTLGKEDNAGGVGHHKTAPPPVGVMDPLVEGKVAG